MKSDIPQLRELIPRSSLELQKETYDQEQIEAAMGPVFGVDEQLIEDGTLYVVEQDGRIVGCGGWSFRVSLFGGSAGRREPDPMVDPKKGAARVRSFFIDPDYARRGIGTAILMKCEAAIMQMGFTHVEISATLVGQPLYSKFGYETVEEYQIPLGGTRSMPVVKMTKIFGE